jgi:hypothetical protein
MPKFQYSKSQGIVQSSGDNGRWTTDLFHQHVVSGSTTDFGTATTGTCVRPGTYTTTAGSACTITLPDPAECPGGIVTVLGETAEAHTVTLAQPGGAGKISIASTAWNAEVSIQGTQAVAVGSAVGEAIQLMSDGVGWIVIGCQGQWNVG